ncbi:MAG: F0F1 ATP synthase subunit A [Ureaplasma sp.]|nr:F0F1 ATP synthase subunit A [Ureaplasma sp.]
MDQFYGFSFNNETIKYAIYPIASIILTTVILTLLAICYYIKVKKIKANQTPGKFVLSICMIIDFIKGLVVEVIGKRFVKLTPFFLFIFLTIAMSNLVALFGLKESTTYSTVPLTFSLVVWIGSQVMAAKYQKWSYFNKFTVKIKIKGKKIPIMIQPLEIVSKFTPIISLTFRLWGNIAAGAVIYSIVWWVLGEILPQYPGVSIILIGGFIMFPLLLSYFTLFTGIIQGFVFTILAVTYWGNEIKEGIEYFEEVKHKKEQKLLEQQKALLEHKEKIQNNVNSN